MVQAASIGNFVHIGKNCIIVRTVELCLYFYFFHARTLSDYSSLGICRASLDVPWGVHADLQSRMHFATRLPTVLHSLDFRCACLQGKRCLIKDCVQILDGAVLAPGTVVPPFSVFGGSPGT